MYNCIYFQTAYLAMIRMTQLDVITCFMSIFYTNTSHRFYVVEVVVLELRSLNY